jgi:hypothetical protein
MDKDLCCKLVCLSKRVKVTDIDKDTILQLNLPFLHYKSVWFYNRGSRSQEASVIVTVRHFHLSLILVRRIRPLLVAFVPLVALSFFPTVTNIKYCCKMSYSLGILIYVKGKVRPRGLCYKDTQRLI